ncbi:MAG: PAS domain S-box protein, partial [Desulfuromusa sp.]|nr:PAS domain S-box protein [Desulfuromusa sp.]
MKRQVLQGLTIMLICFLTGGSYIIYAVGDATSQLERAVTMHQTKDSIEELQRGIEKVQLELQLQKIPQPSDLSLLQTDIAGIKKTIEDCFSCDYSLEVIAQLDHLQRSNESYIGRLNTLLLQSPSAAEFQDMIADIFLDGADFRLAVESFVTSIRGEFSGRSTSLYYDIAKVRYLIIFLVIVGPIAVLLLTAYFLKRFTGSVETLVQASDVLKSGDLDHRIDSGLKYEFKQLADSFNAMSHSLKLQQNDLLETRKLYQALFESAGDGIFILDLAQDRVGQIVSANPAAADMHGYQVEELSGMNIADVSCDGECPERLQCALEGCWIDYVIERKKKNGHLLLAEVNVGLLDLSEKKYALVFSRDITQKKKEEAELQRANQMVLVGEMAAGLAHEI